MMCGARQARRTSSIWRPELEQVPVRVVEVVRPRAHPLELDRPVDVHPGAAHALDSGFQFVARDVEGEVDAAETLAHGTGRVLLEHERAAVERQALLAIARAG